MTLKKKAKAILKETGTGPTNQMLLIQDGLAVTFHCLLMLSILNDSIALPIIAGLVLGMNMSCSHNFWHQADNFRQYYWDFTMLSSYDWRITHMLSHHLHTNSYHDFEVTVLFPLVDLFPNLKKFWFHKYFSPLYFQFILLIAAPHEYIKKAICLATGRTKFRPETLIPVLQLAAFWIFSEWSYAKSFWMWLLVS